MSSQSHTSLEFAFILSCCPASLRAVLEPLGSIENDVLVIFCGTRQNAEYIQSETYYLVVESLWADCSYSIGVKKVSYRYQGGQILLPIEPAQPDRAAYRRRTR